MISEAQDLSTLRGRLRSLLPGLKDGHGRVVELIIEDPQYVLTATAAEIAQRCEVSSATAVRAVRSAGFGGLPELKQRLARAMGSGDQRPAPRALAEVTTISELTETIAASHIESLHAVRGTLSAGTLEQAVGSLRDAGRVLVTASGTSLPVATDAAYRLTMSGLTVQHTADNYSSVVLAGHLGPGDVLLAVSHSGETRQTLDVVEVAQAAGARVIGVTSFSASPLARTADLPLIAVGNAAAEQLVESSSRIAHLAVVDMLCSAAALGVGG